MLEATIVKHCAPTLAGIKTGNIFSIRDAKPEVADEIHRLDRMLRKKGIRIIPLKRTKGNMLIYIYRPDRLQEDLTKPQAQEILADKGYPCGDTGCWKVYSNESRAKAIFDRYKRCTNAYVRQTRKGKPLESLVVNGRDFSKERSLGAAPA